MVWRGNLTKFESSNISETREATPIKIGVHAFDNSYLHKFFEPILFDSIFSRSKGKFGQNWKLILSPKPERPHPPKLVYMHLTSAPICMKFFNRFYFWPPWTMIVHGPKGNFGHFEDKCKGGRSPKVEKPHLPKLCTFTAAWYDVTSTVQPLL